MIKSSAVLAAVKDALRAPLRGGPAAIPDGRCARRFGMSQAGTEKRTLAEPRNAARWRVTSGVQAGRHRLENIGLDCPHKEHRCIRVHEAPRLPAPAAAEGDPLATPLRAETGQPDAYPNLQLVLLRPIDWELIRRQYDEMVKYATALRLGTAQAEAILRRFTRENAQHPTYKALLELGKAVKTVFLARYLHDRSLRVEINDGLNVIEQWNSANDFIFFARRGEVSSNRREDQELSMLSLHLLQNCMVFVNTLMVQQVLARPAWKGRLTARDLHALTPLFWRHVNPYGRFEFDMRTRIAALA